MITDEQTGHALYEMDDVVRTFDAQGQAYTCRVRVGIARGDFLPVASDDGQHLLRLSARPLILVDAPSAGAQLAAPSPNECLCFRVTPDAYREAVRIAGQPTERVSYLRRTRMAADPEWETRRAQVDTGQPVTAGDSRVVEGEDAAHG